MGDVAGVWTRQGVFVIALMLNLIKGVLKNR